MTESNDQTPQPKKARVPLGTQLYRHRQHTFGMYLQVSEGYQLAFEAFNLVAKQIDEGTQKEYALKFPIGLDSFGEVMPSEPRNWDKHVLAARYRQMRDFDLAITAIYSLVTTTEAWFGQLLRVVLKQFPKKIGQNRQVRAATVLGSSTIESAHDAVIDMFLNELSYKSPKEYGEVASDILSVDILSNPAFAKYLEVKATRDIYIHNMGKVNEVYLVKAGTHARGRLNDFLPITGSYFHTAYEACLQLLEHTHDQLEELWEPPESVEAPLFQQAASAVQAGPQNGTDTSKDPKPQSTSAPQ